MALVEIVAVRTTASGKRQEVGTVDGEQISIFVSEDGELKIDNSMGFISNATYTTSDLAGEAFSPGEIHLEVRIKE